MLTPNAIAISLEREGEEPIYKQLIRQIKMQIESGALPAGSRLPASRDLAKYLNISRISVVNAYAELRATGYLSAHAGRGTFVSKEGNGETGLLAHSPIAPAGETILPDHSVRNMMQMAKKAGIINFGDGAPPGEFVPVQHLRDAMNAVLDRDGAAALTYEEGEGYMPLRMTVRDYVRTQGIRCRAEQVLITGGAQQGIDLVVQALVGANDVVITTNPTYLGFLDIARTRRVSLHGIPCDEHGIRLDMLENYLMDNPSKLLYIMPSFQNPTGAVMPMHRRRQLVNLANIYNLTILEDAVYHELRFEGESLPPLKALDTNGNIIHVSAFTKMLLPGMRIGYLIADGRHFDRLLRVKQAADIATPGLNQRAIQLLLERGILPSQLERSNRELRRRRNAALVAAERYFPSGSRWVVPSGGLYLWVELPRNGPTATELFITALQMEVSFAIGTLFYTNGGGNYHMRINYSLQRPDMIDEGFRRIGLAWRTLAADYIDISKSPVM